MENPTDFFVCPQAVPLRRLCETATSLSMPTSHRGWLGLGFCGCGILWSRQGTRKLHTCTAPTVWGIKADVRIHTLEKNNLIALISGENQRQRETRTCVVRYLYTSRRACSVNKSAITSAFIVEHSSFFFILKCTELNLWRSDIKGSLQK